MRRCVSFVLVFALAACSQHAGGGPVQTSGGRHPWTIPNVLRIESGPVPRTLNPILATETVESSIDRLFSDPLVDADGRGRPVPVLAAVVPTRANGGISADGRTIVYHLRHGVHWQDGAPFTSRDVRFTFDAIMSPNNNVISRRGYDLVERVTTPDPHTIVFHFREPFSPAITTIFGESDSTYTILPAHLLERLPNVNEIPFNSLPIGTGPFRVVRWIHGDHIELTRNDGYFLGKPKLQSIVVKFVPDENTEINQLRTHEIDWMFEATSSAYKSLRTLQQTRVDLTPVNGYFGLMFNNRRPPFDDVRVRRAVSYAIDKAPLARDVTYGSAVPATGDLPPFEWAYDPSIHNIPFDRTQSAALLHDAGYARGADGYLARGGKRLTIDLAYEQSAYTNRLTAIQVQSALRALGIEVTLRALTSSVIYGAYGAGGTLATGKYQMALYLWFAGVDPDDSSQFLCSTLPPVGYNNSFFCDPAMDAAQKEALSTFDRAKRRAAYTRIERILVDRVPIDFLFWQRQIQGLNPDLKGFDPNPIVETWNAYRWSI